MCVRQPLTSRQMRNCMTALRETIEDFDRYCGRDLLFFNDLSFYNHIRRCPVTGSASRCVDDLLDRIEPYIPLTLSDENFDLFVNAAREAEDCWDGLPDYFTQKARMDFVALLRRTDGPDGWEWLFSVCDAIRELKTELALI